MSGGKSSLEEMLEEYLNPRPKNVEAAEDVIGGGAAVMPYHEDFQAESASKGKTLRKSVKEALPLRASDLSMGTRYHGSKVSRKDLEEEGWEIEESSDDEEEEDGEEEEDNVPKEKAQHPFDHENDGEMMEDDDEEDGDEGVMNGDEDDNEEEEENGADDDSDEEIEIGHGGKILIKAKGGAAASSPNKRKRVMDDDEEEEEDDDQEGDEMLGSEDEEEDNAGDEDDDDDDEEDMEGLDMMSEMQEGEEKLEKELQKLKEEEKRAVTSIRSDNRKELEKAVHTKNQKLLWNSFMELRISFQQMLNAANRFPHPAAYSLFTSPAAALSEKKRQKRQNKKQKKNEEEDVEEKNEDEEQEESDEEQEGKTQQLKKGLNEASSSLASLFNGLFSAKKTLLASNDSFAAALPDNISKDSSDLDENGEDTDKSVEPQWEDFLAVEDNLWKRTDEVIDRWNRKTMLSQGIVQKEFKAINRTVLNQISQLMADKHRLVKRTQLKRSSAKVIGAALYPSKKKEEEDKATPNDAPEDGKKKEKEEEYDEEIFDDSDFYHQLLRELVESGTANVTDPIALGRSHAQLRRMLRKNKKKDVDQKASKGRKLRYDVMAPLVNFMPAITNTQQVTPMANELFAHLFSS